MAKLKDLLNLPALYGFVEEAGFKQPTDVQAAVIPRLLAGQSLSVLAQTGSGKTLAYALPMVELLKIAESNALEKNPQERAPTAWIICPTEELGTQIEKIFKTRDFRSDEKIKGPIFKKTWYFIEFTKGFPL